MKNDNENRKWFLNERDPNFCIESIFLVEHCLLISPAHYFWETYKSIYFYDMGPR